MAVLLLLPAFAFAQKVTVRGVVVDETGAPLSGAAVLVQGTRDTDPSLYAKVAAIGGHIVIRVQPGGDVFWVYMLDDTDFEYKVKSIHGPYTCE